jgi:hypothetical protein
MKNKGKFDTKELPGFHLEPLKKGVTHEVGM